MADETQKEQKKEAPKQSSEAKAAAKEEKAQKEAQQAQAIASTQGTTPPPSAAPTPDDPEKVAAAEAVANDLVELSHNELARLRSAVDSAMQKKGLEPAGNGPSLEEVSGTLPVNAEAMKELSVKDAAGKFDDVDTSDVVGYAVRQARGIDDQFFGPSYLRVVTADGAKHVTAL